MARPEIGQSAKLITDKHDGKKNDLSVSERSFSYLSGKLRQILRIYCGVSTMGRLELQRM